MMSRNGRRRKNILLMGVTMLVIASAVAVAVLCEDRHVNRAVNGEFHIGSDDKEIVYLDGQWAFEWGELLDADEAAQMADMVDIPSSWNANGLAAEPMRAFGAATYALKITGAVPGESYTLRIPSLHMSGRYYINDTLIYEAGQPALTEAGYSPKVGVGYATFVAPDDSFLLIAHIANFDHSRGGLLLSLKMGSSSAMTESRVRQAGYDYAIFFVICGLFAAACFFVIWNKGKRCSWFYLLAVLLMFWQHVTSGDKLIVQWFPDISVYVFSRMQYIVLFLLPPVLVRQIYGFCSQSNPNKQIRVLFYILFGVGIALSLVCVTAPMWFFTWLANFGYILSTIYIILSVILVAMAMLKSPEKKGVLLYFGACVAMGSGAIFDFLNRLTIIHGVFVNMTIGFIVASIFLGISLIWQMIEIGQKAFMYRHAYLIAQVKPHFVFNALNTVIGTIHEDAYLAERLAHSFSVFLRSAIDQEKMKDLLPLESEIETLKAYLEIEMARHNDIRVSINIAPMPDIMLPPFTLQPLVENAIKHGLNLNQGGGSIAISCEEKKDKYVLSIRDDGAGMTGKQLKSVRESLTSRGEMQIGIGLSNVNERFYKVYHTPIRIESEPGKGTCVQLIISKKKL